MSTGLLPPPTLSVSHTQAWTRAYYIYSILAAAYVLHCFSSMMGQSQRRINWMGKAPIVKLPSAVFQKLQRQHGQATRPWLSWCLTLNKREKSIMCILCLYGNLKVQVQTCMFDVRLYAFCVSIHSWEKKLIYIFFRNRKAVLWEEGLWPIKSLIQRE